VPLRAVNDAVHVQYASGHCAPALRASHFRGPLPPRTTSRFVRFDNKHRHCAFFHIETSTWAKRLPYQLAEVAIGSEPPRADSRPKHGRSWSSTRFGICCVLDSLGTARAGCSGKLVTRSVEHISLPYHYVVTEHLHD
jgi:hypothetical protein